MKGQHPSSHEGQAADGERHHRVPAPLAMLRAAPADAQHGDAGGHKHGGSDERQLGGVPCLRACSSAYFRAMILSLAPLGFVPCRAIPRMERKGNMGHF